MISFARIEGLPGCPCIMLYCPYDILVCSQSKVVYMSCFENSRSLIIIYIAFDLTLSSLSLSLFFSFCPYTSSWLVRLQIQIRPPMHHCALRRVSSLYPCPITSFLICSLHLDPSTSSGQQEAYHGQRHFTVRTIKSVNVLTILNLLSPLRYGVSTFYIQ